MAIASILRFTARLEATPRSVTAPIDGTSIALLGVDMSVSSRTASFAVLGLLLGGASPALAADTASAQALFDAARTKMKEGHFREACPLFEESQRLEPAIGTLYNLAACHEAEGRIAAAWGEYSAVAAQAKARGQKDRESIARARVVALEPRLPWLTVRAAAADTAGLVVERDGTSLGAGQLGAPIPVEPGKHHVVAKAPGYQTWETDVTVAEGLRASVDVPKLVPLKIAVAPMPVVDPAPTNAALATSSPPEPRATGRTERTIAIGLGALAVASAGVGTYFGIASAKDADASRDHCNGNACNETGVSLRDEAMREGNLSTAFFAGAGALVVGGVVLWLVAPNDRARVTGRGVGITF